MFDWVQAVLVVGASVLATLLIVFILRSRRGTFHIPGSSDPEAVYVTTLGTLYAIFLAFMIFVVWTRWYEAMGAADHEANAVVDIFHLALVLPQPESDQLRDLCIQYVEIVVKTEWDQMRQGSSRAATTPIIRKMWNAIQAANSDSTTDYVVRDHVLDKFLLLTDLRRSRLLESSTSLPGLLYAVLALGAAVTIAAAVLFSAQDPFIHALKACLLTALISLMLYAVVALDRPFQGPVRVWPTPFEGALQAMQSQR